MQSSPLLSRTKFILPGEVVEGTITSVLLNTDPFHCTLKVTPTDPESIPAEGRYSDNELSLGKLRRNLIHLQFQIKDLEDILSAVESLEGRRCTFRIDKSGWISWIQKLIVEPVPTQKPAIPTGSPTEPKWMEIFFIRVPKHKSIFEMKDVAGHVWGFAVGPTGSNTSSPHGWVLNIDSIEEAKQILKQRQGKV